MNEYSNFGKLREHKLNIKDWYERRMVNSQGLDQTYFCEKT